MREFGLSDFPLSLESSAGAPASAAAARTVGASLPFGRMLYSPLRALAQLLVLEPPLPCWFGMPDCRPLLPPVGLWPVPPILFPRLTAARLGAPY